MRKRHTKFLAVVGVALAPIAEVEVAASVALADCEEGDAAAAIPVLERKLANARVKLPDRL